MVPLFAMEHVDAVTQRFAAAPTFVDRIVTIFGKLFNRIVTEEIESATGSPFAQADMPALLFALNDLFAQVPRRDKGVETQYDVAVNLLKKMCLHVGSDQVNAGATGWMQEN